MRWSDYKGKSRPQILFSGVFLESKELFGRFFVEITMEEKQHIGSLFDRIAETYDVLNHGLSLSIDRRWRKKTVAQMQSAREVLDVAVGTADLAIEMLQRGKAGHVTGLDLSREMMRIGKLKVERSGLPAVDFVYGNAQEMPFADNQFDAVTCAFGCRNFQDLDAGLREMLRVVKPGGQVTILEFSYPKDKTIRFFYNFYFDHVLPLIGWMVSKDKTAYRYLNKSVKHFIWGEAFAQHMRDTGFVRETFKPLTFGICTVYTAYKNNQ